MALLHLCHEAKVRPFVLHVNYHMRPSALRDQGFVQSYCERHDIAYMIVDASFPRQGNFQSWAREIRYQSARDYAKQNQCEGMMSAHHKDDVLETYVMQKKAKKSVGHYGIKKEGRMLGERIVRPLLDFTKEELIRICENAGIEYGVDESNEKPNYERNKTRIELKNMTDEDKGKLFMEMEDRNHRIEAMRIENEEIALLPKLIVDELKNNRQLLRMWLMNHSQRQRYSSNFLDEILNQSRSDETIEIKLDELESLLFQYGRMKVIAKSEEYSIELKTIEYKDYGVFKIQSEGETRERLNVFPEDFPLIVRKIKSGDRIRLAFGTKNIVRWCVDRKIPLDQRREILVIENKDKEIIFASGIGANVTHTYAHPKVFVVK